MKTNRNMESVFTPALTPALSPRRGSAPESADQMEIVAAAGCATDAANVPRQPEPILRTPSPGGEGRGEGGSFSKSVLKPTVFRVTFGLLLLWLALPAFVHATPQTLYQTSFEPPAFTPGLPIRGQDDWETFHDGEAISISTNNPRTGLQCLRMDGSLLEQVGPNFARAYCFSYALQNATGSPPPIVEITAYVRLDGPQTGTNGAPADDLMSANLFAAAESGGRGIQLGGFFVSSAGKIFTFGSRPEDAYKFAVAYPFGTYQKLVLRVDFVARTLRYFVNGTHLGFVNFAPSITSDRLAGGYLELAGPAEPQTMPYPFDPANYTAYFDDYSLVSIPLSPVNAIIEFANTNVLADEFMPTASVTVIRRGFTNAAVRVTVSTEDDTAKSGEDYEAVSTFVTFAAGETNKVVAIPLRDDYWPEPDKSFLVRISGLPPGATSPKSFARVLIRDNERPGSIDSSWSSTLGLPPLGPSEVLYADPRIVMQQQDGKLILNITVWDSLFNTSPFWRIVRIKPDGSVDPAFQVFEDRSNAAGAQQVVAAPDGKIMVVEYNRDYGYRFQSRLNPDGTQDTNFTVVITGPITTVVPSPDGKIFVVGGDSLNAVMLNGQRMPRLFRVNNDGTLDSSFVAPRTIFYANLWPQSNGQVMATSSETQERWANNLYRLNHDGSHDTSFQFGAARGLHNWINEVLTQPDGRFVVAGSFETYNGQVRNSIVRLNPNGSIDPSFQSGTGFVDTQSWPTNVSGQVSVSELSGGQLLASGYFHTYDGQSVPSTLLLNPDGTRDPESALSDEGTSIFFPWDGEPSHYPALFVRGQFVAGLYYGLNYGAFFPTGYGLGRLRTELALRIVSTERDREGATHLTANALSGHSYTLQSSEDLANWGDLATQLATTNRIEFTDAPATLPTKRFYRVKQN